MKKMIIALAALCWLTGCGGKNGDAAPESSMTAAVADQPAQQWNEKRYFDRSGNLAGYDSGYSWSWSGSARSYSADSMVAAFNRSLQFPLNFSGWQERDKRPTNPAPAYPAEGHQFFRSWDAIVPVLNTAAHRDSAQAGKQFSGNLRLTGRSSL